MGISLRNWIRVSFLSLLVVAFLGIILRYKIAYSLPFIEQKNLHHGHSHFAFSGWVTQVLMVLMVQYIYRLTGRVRKIYTALLYINLFSAYGMLVFFILWGYGFWSIGFSVLSIAVSVVFAIGYIRDLLIRDRKKVSHWWFTAALIFSVLSSLGTYAEAYLMANRIIHQNWLFIYVLVVAAAILQCTGWALMLHFFKQNKAAIQALFGRSGRLVLILSGFALTLKLLLQLGSTHPALSQLAFGFRPIVIGYLHLVLLGVITLFIIGFSIGTGIIPHNRFLLAGTWIFIGGVVINELLLMLQGVMGLSYEAVPHIDQWLLGASIVMFTGILLLNTHIHRSEPETRE
ncbi:MAG: hypothetical protein IPP31_07130 [Chitinophagaceae bacterium]|nr:hypothetical protein [Chitinophagaceae bacterium]